MRQEIINIYKIDEHPNKEACLEYMRNNWHDLGQWVIDDMLESLEALANAVGGKLDYRIGIVPDRGEFVEITDYDREVLQELYNKKDECPLAGTCYACYVLEGLINTNFSDTVLNVLHSEGDYIYSDEGLIEHALNNGYEFTTNGEFFA